MGMVCFWGGLLVSFQCSATMVLNGNFETPALAMNSSPTYTPGTTPDGFGWTVLTGSIEHVRDGGWYGPSGNGDRFIDLDGNYQPGAIAQNVTLSAGSHTVYFMLAGNPGDQGWKGLRVSLGGKSSDFYFNTVGHRDHDLGWVLASATFSFETDINSSLEFRSLDRANSAWGPLLDDVYIDQMPTYAGPVVAYSAPSTIPILPSELVAQTQGDPGYDDTGGSGGSPTVVPEPTTWIAGCFALALLAVGGKGRRIGMTS